MLDDDTPLKILLAYGAEMDPLASFHAIGSRRCRNDMAITIALVEHGADVNYMARLWATPLHHAVSANAKDQVVYLLENGADPGIHATVSKSKPVDWAKQKGKAELVKILVEVEARQGG